MCVCVCVCGHVELCLAGRGLTSRTPVSVGRNHGDTSPPILRSVFESELKLGGGFTSTGAQREQIQEAVCLHTHSPVCVNARTHTYTQQHAHARTHTHWIPLTVNTKRLLIFLAIFCVSLSPSRLQNSYTASQRTNQDLEEKLHALVTFDPFLVLSLFDH